MIGTAGPSSDEDWFEVVLPSEEQILLGKASFHGNSTTGDNGSKNTSSDVDVTRYSLQRFVELLAKMDTNCTEVLFAKNILCQHAIWEYIVKNRMKFINLQKGPVIGYSNNMMNRYALKGKRLLDFEKAVQILTVASNERHIDCQEIYKVFLKKIPNAFLVETKFKNQDNVAHVVHLNGKKFDVRVAPKDAMKPFKNALDQAGHRAIKSMESDTGADNKGVYHGMRILDEMLELFTEGHITLPSPHVARYMDIRVGNYDVDEVMNEFYRKLESFERLEVRNQYDPTFTRDFMLKIHKSLLT